MLGDLNCPGVVGGIDSKLSDFLSDREFEQLVKFPTRKDNILDLVIVSPEVHFVSCPGSPINIAFSDHRLIILSLDVTQNRSSTTTYTYRNLKKIDTTQFINLLRASPIFTHPPTDPDQYVTEMDRDVTGILDIVAPVCT